MRSSSGSQIAELVTCIKVKPIFEVAPNFWPHPFTKKPGGNRSREIIEPTHNKSNNDWNNIFLIKPAAYSRHASNYSSI